MLLIESAFILLALAAVFVVPRTGTRLLQPVERCLAALSKRRRLTVFTVGAVALALRAAVLPVLPVPYPGGHDEFSYLLMADTFVHGRLTNPTHPLWVHFENISVIHHPTYCSMYYPAQGAVLAVGQLLGHPFLGVWLSVGLMCAAICWMLQGWVAPYWAFLGGLLAAIRLATLSYWAYSYCGGAVAATGGALVLGALPRIQRRQQLSDGLMMGVGFALLIGTRPFEGLFFSIPIVGYLIWIVHRCPAGTLRHSLVRIILPLSVILLASIGFMFYYFWRTTGNPFLPPYLVCMRTYSVEPNFPWLRERSMPHYSHEMLRRYYLGYNLTQFHLTRAHPVFSLVMRVLTLWFFFLGPLLSLPVLALGFALPKGLSLKQVPAKTKFLVVVCGVTFAGMLLPVYINPHYAAPITCAIYALLMLSMQRLHRWRKDTMGGVFVIRAVMVGAVGLLLVYVAIPVFHLSIVNSTRPYTWCSPGYQLLPRRTIEERLGAESGNHVVLVRFGANNTADDDAAWVNNAADIDHSRIVWAHDMGEQNEELIRYFPDRKFWLLESERDSISLTPYNAKTKPNLSQPR